MNWSIDDQYHVTINFIGDMLPEQRQEMCDGLESCPFSFKKLQVEISRLSYFPNDKS